MDEDEGQLQESHTGERRESDKESHRKHKAKEEMSELDWSIATAVHAK